MGTEIAHRTVETNGIRLHIAEAGAGPLVLFLHGWPESWYSWRHQLPAVAEAGYHAVAPDVRGYGDSDKPAAIEAYSMRTMVADYVGLLDALGERTAVVVGHDWGAPMAYHCALLAPQRFRAVVGMSVPWTGRPAAPPLETLAQIFKDSFFYIDYFQQVGVAEKELEADVRRSMKLILYGASGDAPPAPGFAGKPKGAGLLDGMADPATLPAWLTEADLDFYAGEFAKSGFRGPINRYRNMDRDWHELPQLAGAHIKQPCLFVAGEKDGVIAMNPQGIETMKANCDDLRGVVLIPGAGHWTQQERPAETTAALVEFLKGL
ncbi:MAG: alpha/beta hydrolase [Chloroflexi bacterium]|nr:alpha/beta hydrolase [Chloroflexota bacterium]